MNKIDKPYIFITGAPRSGTSMLTKVIDAHPDIGIFMENIFQLRRRHWQFPEFWDNEEELFNVVQSEYVKIKEPIVGNKVCTPDVWNTDEILKMASYFSSSKIIFIVRNPIDVINSRINRERNDHFSEEAKKYLSLDWRSKYFTYYSSWRQSIEIFWKLQEHFGKEDTLLIYYEDIIEKPADIMKNICNFLGLKYSLEMESWHEKKHYDSKGTLKHDLKYKDEPITTKKSNTDLPDNFQDYLNDSLHFNLWKKRSLNE